MTFTFFPILGNYEVLPTEPLHDMKEHIANVLTELPSHLENEKNAFQDIIEYSLGGKEKLRGCDYRLAAVIVAQYLRGNENKIIIIIITIIKQWNLNIMKG